MSTETYQASFASLAQNGGRGPAWLWPIREAALDRFVREGFPSRKHEDWRFTNVQPIAKVGFQPQTVPDPQPTLADIRPYLFGHEEWPRLVFVNGHLAPTLSRLEGLSSEVRVSGLRAAQDADPATVQAHLTTLAVNAPSVFTELNTALHTDGAFVHLTREAVIELPIHVLFVTAAHAAEGAAHPRNLIVVDRHAQATVLESYVSLTDGRYLTNAVTEIALADGARLNHYKVQRESEAAFHIGTIEANQARSSHFESFSFALGATLSRTNVYTVLDGEGGHATLNGLYIGHGSQHVDHQTRIEHAQPACTSHEVYKGMLDDRSHAVFNGKVYVRPEAQQTDGKQTNMNLLLSDKAKVDTKPQLEIFADDVKCTHGATVGQLDETALFYCRTRGIPLAQARTMVTYGFAADVIEEIHVPAVAEHLEGLVRDRLEWGRNRPAA